MVVENPAWDQVAEPDGGQTDEAEVESVQEEPVLPLTEENGPTTDVGDEDGDTQGYRHRHSAEWLRLVLGQLVLLLVLEVLLLIGTDGASQTVVRQTTRS